MFFFVFREDFNGSCPGPEFLMLGKDVFSPLAGQGKIFLYLMKDAFWGSMKSAGYVGSFMPWKNSTIEILAVPIEHKPQKIDSRNKECEIVKGYQHKYTIKLHFDFKYLLIK